MFKIVCIQLSQTLLVTRSIYYSCG